MTQEEFLIFIETFGSKIEFWPEDRKSQAIAYMQSHPEIAQAHLNMETELDNILDSLKVEPGVDMLAARILNSTQAETMASIPHSSEFRAQGLGYRAVAAMVLGAFALGFIGASMVPIDDTLEIPAHETVITADSEWGDYADAYEMGDLYEWVAETPAP